MGRGVRSSSMEAIAALFVIMPVVVGPAESIASNAGGVVVLAGRGSL